MTAKQTVGEYFPRTRKSKMAADESGYPEQIKVMNAKLLVVMTMTSSPEIIVGDRISLMTEDRDLDSVAATGRIASRHLWIPFAVAIDSCQSQSLRAIKLQITDNLFVFKQTSGSMQCTECALCVMLYSFVSWPGSAPVPLFFNRTNFPITIVQCV